MTDERRPDELTEEELEAQVGAALPNRELMSILPLPGDPLGTLSTPIPNHQFDPQYDPSADDAGDDVAG